MNNYYCYLLKDLNKEVDLDTLLVIFNEIFLSIQLQKQIIFGKKKTLVSLSDEDSYDDKSNRNNQLHK